MAGEPPTCPVLPHHRVKAEQWLAELWRDFPLSRPVSLEWRRFRTTAGVAVYNRNVIGLSINLLGEDERLRSTLVHEYAHLLAYDRFGRAGANHGPAWRAAMRDLGAEPIVRHSWECARNTPRTMAVYRCRKCNAEFRRLRILRRRVKHATCGGLVDFVGKFQFAEKRDVDR